MDDLKQHVGPAPAAKAKGKGKALKKPPLISPQGSSTGVVGHPVWPARIQAGPLVNPSARVMTSVTTEILKNNPQILFAKGGAAHQKPNLKATTEGRWAQHLKTLRCCDEENGMSVRGGYFVRGFCVELARTEKGTLGTQAKKLIKPWEDAIIKAIEAVEAASDTLQSSNHQDDIGGTGGRAPKGLCEGIAYIVGGYLVYDPKPK